MKRTRIGPARIAQPREGRTIRDCGRTKRLAPED
jgi:hypothetical protein